MTGPAALRDFDSAYDRNGSMLSKNSVISEVGGVCETDDLFCSCFRGQLLGPGGQMVLSTQLTLTPV